MRKPFRRLLIVSLLLLAGLMLSPAAAQSYSWSAPFEVSDTARFSWFPDLAAGPDGSVHIIWASGDSDPADPRLSIDLLRYRELRGGAWSETNDILYTGVGGYTVRNSMALGRDGLLHVVVRMQTRLFTIAAPWEQAWSARSWGEPQALTAPGAYYTALEIDSANTLHALWSEAVLGDDPEKPNPNCPACSDMYYRRSNDGGKSWTQPTNLSNSLDDGENRPQIAIDGQNRIHAVWDQGVDWYAGAGVPKYAIYRRSDDGGNSWSPAVLFGSPDAPVQQIAVAVTPEGNPFVVYRSAAKDLLYFQRSGDGGASWTPPTEIPSVRGRDLNDNNLDRYSLAIDAAGQVHLLMVGFLNASPAELSNPWLLHLSFDGLAWSVPQIVMGNELYPEWPKLVTYAGNQLHATWFTRHKEDLFGSDQGAHYQVWYSSLQVAAPAVAPPPLFTPVPTAQPAPSPLPTALPPTATPLPAIAAQAPIIAGPPQWEGPGLLTVGLALTPVIGLLAICWAVVSWRRRG
jgi:BNR repeat-like domain